MQSHVKFLLFTMICFSIMPVFAQENNWKDVEFLRADGSPYEIGLAGGLTAAQFNEIDLNLDGTLDLLIFDRDGKAIIPLLYIDDTYNFHPEYISIFPALNNWVRLRDFNQDGIMDIFCYNIEAPLSGVEVWKGEIVGGKLGFSKIAFKEGDFEILYYGFQNQFYNMQVISSDIPEVIDVDGDGDLDILTFSPDNGYVLYYKNTNVENGESLEYPKYVLEDGCWGKFYESGFNEDMFLSNSPSQCYTPFTSEDNPNNKNGLHAGSTLSAFDQDLDGDYEVLIGDLTSEHVVFLENGGTKENAWMTVYEKTFPSYDVPTEFQIFTSSFLIDVDRDGRKDVLVCPNNRGGVENYNNVWYYKNDALPNQELFSFQKKNAFTEWMVDLGSYSSPTFCDVNQDGLLDIVVGTFGFFVQGSNPDARLHLFMNVGDLNTAKYQLVDQDYLELSAFSSDFFTYAPSFGDLDGDGDDDLLVGTNSGKLIYIENIAGAGKEYSFDSPQFNYLGIDVGDNIKPQIVDLNKDGLMDIIIGEKNQNKDPITDNIGNINYFQNIGTATEPEFGIDEKIAPNENTLGDVLVKPLLGSTGAAAPFFYDTGEKFLLWVGSDNGTIHRYDEIEDNIYGSFNQITADIGIRIGARTAPAIADIDGDDILDMVIGNSRGGLSFISTGLLTDGSVSTASVYHNETKIFPNPVTDLLRVESEKPFHNYKIYNLLGQEIKSGIFERDQYINVADITEGMYMLHLMDGQDNAKVYNFIKN